MGVGIVPFYQGRTNPAFSKPCLFLSDTRHFRHFVVFRGLRSQTLVFQWVECEFVIFAVFVKTAPFGRGQKHGLPKTRFVRPRFIAKHWCTKDLDSLTDRKAKPIGMSLQCSLCPSDTTTQSGSHADVSNAWMLARELQGLNLSAPQHR